MVYHSHTMVPYHGMVPWYGRYHGMVQWYGTMAWYGTVVPPCHPVNYVTAPCQEQVSMSPVTPVNHLSFCPVGMKFHPTTSHYPTTQLLIITDLGNHEKSHFCKKNPENPGKIRVFELDEATFCHFLHQTTVIVFVSWKNCIISWKK